MLIVVLVVAVISLAVLATAIVTGNTILALVVIALAAVGLVLMARDWYRERGRAGTESTAEADAGADEHRRSSPDEAARDHVTEHEHSREQRALEPDMFEPDVSYEEAEQGMQGSPESEQQVAERESKE